MHKTERIFVAERYLYADRNAFHFGADLLKHSREVRVVPLQAREIAVSYESIFAECGWYHG